MSSLIASLSTIDWSAIWAAITTITTALAGVIAAIQNKLKNNAEAETAATQAFFDPDNNEAMTPTDATPERSWKMSDATRTSILAGKTAEDKLSIIEQIQKAEDSGYVDYKIVWSGGQYSITYGLIESSEVFETAVEAETTSDPRADTELGRGMILFEKAIAAGKIKLDRETEYYVNKDDAWYFTAWEDGRYSFHSPWYPEKAIALSSL